MNPRTALRSTPSPRLRRRAIRATATLVLAGGLVAGAISGCSGSSTSPAATGGAGAISSARCDKNKAAGAITYLTSYAFATTPTILDVLAADQLGYFKDLCLDITLQSGSTNAQLISAGTAQFGGLGSASDVMVARDSDAKDILSIATYGNTDAIELITMANSGINSLKDFEGKTVGYKGAIAPQFTAMFKSQGVDTSKINWVSVGYDPTILPQGQVQGLGAYKSNEPKQLEAAGYKLTEWDPAKYGVKSTFNTQIVNATFAKKNPTAVEDFLRASFKAYAWINDSDANLAKAIGWAKDRSQAGFNVALSTERWKTEVKLISDSQPKGLALGQQSVAQWQPEADLLLSSKLVKSAPAISADQGNSYIDSIYQNGKLVWPAP